MVTGIMYMGEVPTGTYNTTNYSVNNQGRDNPTNFTNNSPNNQGRAYTNDSTNNQGRGDTNNNQGRGNISDHNDTTNTSTDNMDRDSNTMSEFNRVFTQTTLEMGDLRHIQSTIRNNRSLMFAFLEQLNQPNLPQEENTRLQQHYTRLRRLDAIYTEQANDKIRELAERSRQLSRLIPLLTRNIEENSDIE